MNNINQFNNDQHHEHNESQCETCEGRGFDQNFQDQPKEKKNKRKRCSDSLINKWEGFAIFFVLLAAQCAFSIIINKTIVNNNAELESQLSGFRTQIIALEQQVESLREELEIHHAAETEKPIDITIKLDGVTQNVTSGEAVSDPDFDTSPFLGVSFYEGNDGSANPIGLQVDYVYESSPAYFAGMKAGDIIVSVCGVKINNLDDLTTALAQHKANDTIEMEIATITENGISVIAIAPTLTYRGNFDLG